MATHITKSDDVDWSVVMEFIDGTLYGNCVGDAIGLLTEFMSKQQAKAAYGKFVSLDYSIMVIDSHRLRIDVGDWTDDSDQMLCILQSLTSNKGEVNERDVAARFVRWMKEGFSELGDTCGRGIGRTTRAVLTHPKMLTEPHTAAREVWERFNRQAAPNGAVMRTSVLGIHRFWDLDSVVENTVRVAKVTHHDPRCVASCVAVTTAIAQLLTDHAAGSQPDLERLVHRSYGLAAQQLLSDKERLELKFHMHASLEELRLDESDKIGYTYKTMGAGFWALRQNDYEDALSRVTMEAGDADTNAAVAGALIGCRLGYRAIPERWVGGLVHRDWLKSVIDSYKDVLVGLPSKPTH